MIVYFSATGNSKYVAERIAEEFGDTAVSIEESDGRIELEDGGMIGFVTPVYWWELPAPVRGFLQDLRIDGAEPSYVHRHDLRNHSRLHLCRSRENPIG
ncbi:MAG: hypothetical protein A3208_04115 [Candidatus Methanoprimaticola hominis]|nr:MAG: hypothetical protein A3208_04115 [Methanomassiliicoccales archaeon Mx-06]